MNFNEYIKTASSCLYCNISVSNISSPMLLSADNELLTDAGVLTVPNAGVVVVDLKLTKILFSLEKNHVLHQVLPQIRSIPAAGLALRLITCDRNLHIFSHIFVRFLSAVLCRRYQRLLTSLCSCACNAVFMSGMENCPLFHSLSVTMMFMNQNIVLFDFM
ncbi:hypothetical protein ILYODFUR_027734 [Ilyodon furcidens]|uniref:Uncharacterized protein n=1 Tax=Ilyodon furcidens TaxID=33524 RepID=A0ABV0UJJ9_9TELE